MNEEQKQAIELIQKNISDFKAEILKNSVNPADIQNTVKELKDSLKTMVTNEQFKGFEDKFNEMSKNLDELALKVSKNQNVATEGRKDIFREQLKVALADVKKRLENRSTGSFVTVGEKTVEKIDPVLHTSVTGTLPAAQYDPGFNNIARQMFVLEAAANVVPTESNTVAWTEQTTVTGSAANTAEGSGKSQIGGTWNVRTANLEKITGYTKVSTEALDDIEGLLSEIQSEIEYQIALQKETQLLSGNHSTPNIAGITHFSQTVDLASLADSVQTPNEMDCIAAAMTQISVNMKGAAMPTNVFINPVDRFKIITSKSTTDEYVVPQWVLNNGLVIENVVVKQSVTIPAGYFLVADMKKFNVRKKGGIKIQIGWDGNDFTENKVTILGEERLCSYIKANDVEAFVYDQFTSVKSFIDNGS